MKIFLIVALAIAVLWAGAKWRSLQAAWLATRKFLREVRVEMQKVTWPSRTDSFGSTVVVLTAVVLLGISITLWDEALSWVLKFVLQGRGA